MKLHIAQNCIMITGSGEPDIATQAFLNRLHAATKLPVYALVNRDPLGVQFYLFNPLALLSCHISIVGRQGWRSNG